MRIGFLALSLLYALALGGCGQKGPLYLPPPDDQPQAGHERSDRDA
jgi:predicted small lipoprotein YifL